MLDPEGQDRDNLELQVSTFTTGFTKLTDKEA